MTPKEKAEDLMQKYDFVYIANYTSRHEVKQCALIAVDELINAATPVYDSFWPVNTTEYWQEVKQEIENI